MEYLVIHGPNLNMLGKRQPEIYGDGDYETLCQLIEDYAQEHGDRALNFQSNHEGAIIDAIQGADGVYDGIVINPGAYAHYSYAILDALSGIRTPAVEVHITDISKREDFRKISVTKDGCIAMISGHGRMGYLEAMDLLKENAK